MPNDNFNLGFVYSWLRSTLSVAFAPSMTLYDARNRCDIAISLAFSRVYFFTDCEVTKSRYDRRIVAIVLKFRLTVKR